MKTALRVRRFVVVTAALCLVLRASTLLQAQGRIVGQVLNGTSHGAVPKQEVRLLSPKDGMREAGAASTDANGRFALAPAGVDPSAFYLVETRFQGVPYHVPARLDSNGSATVNLTVYDATGSGAPLRVQALRALVRAAGAKAQVQEEFDVLNLSDPPRAYVNSEGTFHFRLSPGASEPSVAVTGLMNMPLPQTAEAGKTAGEFFIRYPLKPGVTRVGLSYEMDYSSSRLALGDRISYPIDEAELYVSPSSLSVDSPVLKPAGVDPTHNVQKLEARNLPRDTAIEMRLAGEAPATATADSQTAEGGAEVKVVPNSMTALGVPLLACFLLVLLWALGVRVAKEWPQWQVRRGRSPAQKQLGGKVDALVNSLADLDELFASRKIAEAKYWKERLELKARLVAVLKKAPPSLLDSYATRNTAR